MFLTTKTDWIKLNSIPLMGLLAYFVSLNLLFSQKGPEFGDVTKEEYEIKSFEKDSTAAAVYLYEWGSNFFEVRDNYVWLITQYHAKIKVLSNEGFDQASIKIPFYHNDNKKEKVNRIRAITHNGFTKNALEDSDVHTVNVSDRWSQKRFTFPNVKIGSILEFSYEIQSPFFFNLSGWNFQSDIPKMFTEYNAKIPGNWKYNRTLIGNLELSVNEAFMKKNCFEIPQISSQKASCEVLKYSMENVPAFDEKEEFMLSPLNYRSRLDFELSEFMSFNGVTTKYTKTWEDVDKEFKNDKDIGRQLGKENFFEKRVPNGLLEGESPLKMANGIYSFVQEHFNWNGEYGLWRNNRVKRAFDQRRVSVSEINIELINLLNSAGIETKMMLLATRDRALPKKTHPVMSDFNYIVAKANINGNNYLLDASDKDLPFGMLPFKCLNYYGRVMDFETNSYWFDIIPEVQNKMAISALLSFEPHDAKAVGSLSMVTLGYDFLQMKKNLQEETEDDYLGQIEQDYGGEFQISSYEIDSGFSNGKRMRQKFQIQIDDIGNGSDILFNPFLFKFFDRNPLVATERNYPIDFGYHRNYGYSIGIKIPEGYKIKTMPQEKNMVLAGNAGSLKFLCREGASGLINVFFEVKLQATQFRSEAYDVMKEFFNEIVFAQTQSYIVLEKI